MTEQTEETKETGEEIEITPAFENALHFALMTRRGVMLKPFQQRLDELTDQNMVDLIEALAVMVDRMGEKERECNLLREAIEMAEETFETLDASTNEISAKIEQAREGIAEQVAWADERQEA